MRHNQREQEPHNSQIDDCYKRKARRNNPRAFWRRRWDSNPRTLAGDRISSAARYDHFDTSPQIFSIIARFRRFIKD